MKEKKKTQSLRGRPSSRLRECKWTPGSHGSPPSDGGWSSSSWDDCSSSLSHPPPHSLSLLPPRVGRRRGCDLLPLPLLSVSPSVTAIFSGENPLMTLWPLGMLGMWYRIHQGDPSMSKRVKEFKFAQGQMSGSKMWVGGGMWGTGAGEWGKDVRDRNKSQNETPVNKGLLRALTSVVAYRVACTRLKSVSSEINWK